MYKRWLYISWPSSAIFRLIVVSASVTRQADQASSFILESDPASSSQLVSSFQLLVSSFELLASRFEFRVSSFDPLTERMR